MTDSHQERVLALAVEVQSFLDGKGRSNTERVSALLLVAGAHIERGIHNCSPSDIPPAITKIVPLIKLVLEIFNVEEELVH